MPEQNELEVYRQQRTGQDKIAYFLLTAAGAGIGLAVNKTQDTWLGWSLFPLGLAVLAWAVSFFLGCLHLMYTSKALSANGALIRAQKEFYTEPMHHNALQQAKIEGIWAGMEKAASSAATSFDSQFYLVISGGVLFVIWHVLEMYLRAHNSIYG